MGEHTNPLLINYDYYDSTGHKTGEVLITQSMYDAEHWVLFADEEGNIYYYSNSNGTLFFTFFRDGGHYAYDYMLLCNNPGSWEQNNYMKYNPSTEKFETYTCKKSTFQCLTDYNVYGKYVFNPSAILERKSMSVFYYNNSNNTDYISDYFDTTSSVVFPSVSNKNDVALGNYENLYIKLGDCFNYGTIEGELENDTILSEQTYKINKLLVNFIETETGATVYYSHFNNITSSSPYLEEKEDGYYLFIPKTEFFLNNFEVGKNYTITLDFDFSITTVLDMSIYKFTQRYVNSEVFTFDYGTPVIPEEPSDTDKIINSFTNSIGESTNAIKEQTEVNKGIFEQITDILNYINPFSENFFVYKLIELLINALKGLFIPSDDFFNNWISDMNEFFGDRFGILYYPFEVVIEFLTKFVNACDSMSSSSAVINVPNLTFMGITLISAFSYDFNSLLVNDTFELIHNLYLIVVDVIFCLMLLNLAKNTFVEVFGGRFSDEVVGDINYSKNSYDRYVQYQENIQRYKQEGGKK